MFVVEINGNTPLKRRSRYTQILQPGKQEVIHHLVLSGYGRDKIGMRIYIVDKFGRIFAHFEKVSLFVRLFHGTTAIGTFPVNQLTFRPERLARFTVPPFVCSLIYIALFVKFSENFLNLFFVIFIGRTDEFVIRNIHQVDASFYLPGDFVNILLRRLSGESRFVFYFLTVFIGSGLKKHVISLTTLETRESIGHYSLVCIAYMRFRGCIRDSRRNVKFFLHKILRIRLRKIRKRKVI